MPSPKFSVVVATRNRVDSLRRTVQSLLAQSVEPSLVQILVVDDGSTDGTGAYLEEAARRGDLAFVRRRGPRGPAAARNAGAREARGIWIAFTDDDCVVPGDWLERALRAMEQGAAVAIGGAVRNVQPGLLSEVYQDQSNFLFETLNSAPDDPRFLTTNNFICHRSEFAVLGGFDEKFRHGAEDRDLARRLVHRGLRVIVDPGLVVEHSHAFTLWSYLRHLAGQGRGSCRYFRLYGRTEPRPSPGALFERIRHAGRRPDRKWLRIAAAALGQAAVTLGYLRALVFDRPRRRS